MHNKLRQQVSISTPQFSGGCRVQTTTKSCRLSDSVIVEADKPLQRTAEC